MNPNNSIALTYISGLALLVSSFAFGQVEIGLIILGFLYLILGGVSDFNFGIMKLLNTRLVVLIWAVLAILTAFSPNLLGVTANRNLLWGCIILGLLNLLAILVTRFKLDEIK